MALCTMVSHWQWRGSRLMVFSHQRSSFHRELLCLGWGHRPLASHPPVVVVVVVVPVVAVVVWRLKSRGLPKHPSASCLKYVCHCILLAAASPDVFNKKPIGCDSQLAYYYYYYYRKKRFRWRNVKRLQGHLTNAKDSDKTRVRRKVRTEYLSDVIVGRAVEIRKTSSEQYGVNCPLGIFWGMSSKK